MTKATISIVSGAALLSGCATVENVVAGPPNDIEATAPDAPDAYAAGETPAGAPEADWLAQFDDPVIAELVSETLAANPTLAASAANVRAARQTARAVYGRSLPSVSADVSGGYTSQFIDIDSIGVTDRQNEPAYRAQLSASWEADLWGRLADGIKAARADLAATDADLAAAALSLSAQTASAWIDLNEAVAQERVAILTLESRQRVLDLTERRFARGLSTALDVRTARTQVATSEAAIAAQERAKGAAARRLEILLGRYPAAAMDASGALPDLPPLASAGDPLSLLARRPDIAASEARVAAAGFRVDAARAAMLPAFRITATASSTEDMISDFLDPSRTTANIVGAIAAPLFQGGALRADKNAAIARAEAAAANYVAAVFTAWREVEDAIQADQTFELQVRAQARALEEAVLAEDLALRQYENGLVSIFNLLQSQTTRLNTESNLIAARAARATNRVSYHLALGGGVPVPAAQPTGRAGESET
ncbi:MAG: efflux transporter outer membrane subunit [Pseudomonadota bacterium]